jgi:hypothetical protein
VQTGQRRAFHKEPNQRKTLQCLGVADSVSDFFNNIDPVRNTGVYNLLVINEALRRELRDMRTEDMRVRQELLESGELGGSYVPRMEAMHIRNGPA